MSKRWKKRLKVVAIGAAVGGVALASFGGGAGSLGGLTSGLKKIAPKIGGQLLKGRSLSDFVPNAAAVRDSVESAFTSTPGGQAIVNEERSRRIGAFFTSPLGMGLAALLIVGGIWWMRR